MAIDEHDASDAGADSAAVGDMQDGQLTESNATS